MFCARAVETSFLLCMIPPQLHYFVIVCKVHCKYSKSLRETAPIGIFLPIVRCTTTSILSVESGMTEVLGNVRSDLCLQHNQAFLDLVARPEGPLNPGCRAKELTVLYSSPEAYWLTSTGSVFCYLRRSIETRATNAPCGRRGNWNSSILNVSIFPSLVSN